MGLADLVPGVSGGTIALITGIYERLVSAVKVGSSPITYAMLMRGQFKVFWKAVDGTFMCLLLLGILTAVFAASGLVKDLIVNHTSALLSFFCGLTLSAAMLILLGLRPLRPASLAFLAVGVAAAAAVSALPVTSLQQAPPLQGYFLAGMIALCAMILPGISGSFILLLLGVYPYLVDAVHMRDLAVIGSFAAGGVLGRALFVRLLRLLLARHRDITVAAMVGVMLGALPKLWPWKEDSGDIRVILQPSVMPGSADDPAYAAVAVAFVAGAALVVATERLAAKMGGKG